MSITYCEGVFVDLGIQRAKRMRRFSGEKIYRT